MTRRGIVLALVFFNYFLYLFSFILTLSLNDLLTLKFALWLSSILLSLLILITFDFSLRPVMKILTLGRAQFVLNGSLFLFLLVLINLFVAKENKEWDMTSQRLNSLSEMTLNLLQSFPGPAALQLIAPRGQWKDALPLIQLYLKEVDWDLELIDPDETPQRVAGMALTRYPSLVISYQDKTVIASEMNEEEITQKLLQVQRLQDITLCYNANHSTLNFSSESADGAVLLMKALQAEGYQLAELSYDSHQSCDVFLMLGFRGDLVEQEFQYLKNQLQADNPFLILKDANFANLSLPWVNKFLDLLQIQYSDGVVVNQLASLSGVDASVTVIEKFTDEFEQMMPVRDRLVLPITQGLQVNDHQVMLVQSLAFPASWLETDLAGLQKGQAKYQEGKDLPGPIALMVAAQNDQSRWIAMGTTQAFNNQYLGYPGNYALALNAIHWLSEQDFLISLDRPAVKVEKIFMSEEQARMIGLTSLFLTPALMLFAGLCAFFRLRKG